MRQITLIMRRWAEKGLVKMIRTVKLTKGTGTNKKQELRNIQCPPN